MDSDGFFPINTVITVRRDAVERNPDTPRLMMDAFFKAKAMYDADISAGKDDHMGLSLTRLQAETGLRLTDYGFKANRSAIRTMITYCYERDIIRKLYEPEEPFLVADS